MDAVTSQFGLQQLIKELTHILGNSSSCIDLMFTSQPSLVMESGVHPSRHSNCRHQITYAKFNLKILTNVKYGIIRRLILTKLERQSNSFLETGHLNI